MLPGVPHHEPQYLYYFSTAFKLAPCGGGFNTRTVVALPETTDLVIVRPKSVARFFSWTRPQMASLDERARGTVLRSLAKIKELKDRVGFLELTLEQERATHHAEVEALRVELAAAQARLSSKGRSDARIAIGPKTSVKQRPQKPSSSSATAASRRTADSAVSKYLGVSTFDFDESSDSGEEHYPAGPRLAPVVPPADDTKVTQVHGNGVFIHDDDQDEGDGSGSDFDDFDAELENELAAAQAKLSSKDQLVDFEDSIESNAETKTPRGSNGAKCAEPTLVPVVDDVRPL